MVQRVAVTAGGVTRCVCVRSTSCVTVLPCVVVTVSLRDAPVRDRAVF